MVTEKWEDEYDSLKDKFMKDFEEYVGEFAEEQFEYLVTPDEDKEGYFEFDGTKAKKFLTYRSCDLFISDELSPNQRARLFVKNIMTARKGKHIDFFP